MNSTVGTSPQVGSYSHSEFVFSMNPAAFCILLATVLQLVRTVSEDPTTGSIRILSIL
eukprot:COSAG02_NODE_793_length_17156_cov_54.511051_7_plen_58_part_00